MKYVGALIFAVCAAALGYYKSRSLKIRAESCKNVASLALGIGSYIDKLKLPLRDIYVRLSPSNALARTLLENGDIGELIADDEAYERLSAFLDKIGGGFCDEELALCKELEQFANERCELLDKEYQSKGVLYRSLGLIVGLALLIVIA